MSRSEIASSTRGVLAAGWVGSHGSGGEGTGVTGATGVTTGETVLGPRSPQRLQGFPIVRGQEKPSQAGIRLGSALRMMREPLEIEILEESTRGLVAPPVGTQMGQSRTMRASVVARPVAEPRLEG